MQRFGTYNPNYPAASGGVASRARPRLRFLGSGGSAPANIPRATASIAATAVVTLGTEIIHFLLLRGPTGAGPLQHPQAGACESSPIRLSAGDQDRAGSSGCSIQRAARPSGLPVCLLRTNRPPRKQKRFLEIRYEDLERKRTQAETRSIVETNLDRRVNRKLRWNYARKVYCYLVGYSGVVGLLLALHGFSYFPFALPESVLAFLVGSTAAAAIGLVYAVTNGLFGSLKQ